jgi:hypothetical protein
MTKTIMFIAAALMLTISVGAVAPAHAASNNDAAYRAEAGAGR